MLCSEKSSENYKFSFKPAVMCCQELTLTLPPSFYSLLPWIPTNSSEFVASSPKPYYKTLWGDPRWTRTTHQQGQGNIIPFGRFSRLQNGQNKLITKLGIHWKNHPRKTPFCLASCCQGPSLDSNSLQPVICMWPLQGSPLSKVGLSSTKSY